MSVDACLNLYKKFAQILNIQTANGEIFKEAENIPSYADTIYRKKFTDGDRSELAEIITELKKNGCSQNKQFHDIMEQEIDKSIGIKHVVCNSWKSVDLYEEFMPINYDPVERIVFIDGKKYTNITYVYRNGNPLETSENKN